MKTYTRISFQIFETQLSGIGVSQLETSLVKTTVVLTMTLWLFRKFDKPLADCTNSCFSTCWTRMGHNVSFAKAWLPSNYLKKDGKENFMDMICSQVRGLLQMQKHDKLFMGWTNKHEETPTFNNHNEMTMSYKSKFKQQSNTKPAIAFSILISLGNFYLYSLHRK